MAAVKVFAAKKALQKKTVDDHQADPPEAIADPSTDGIDTSA